LRCLANAGPKKVPSTSGLRRRGAALEAQANAFDIHGGHDENFAERKRMASRSSDLEHG